MIASFNRFELAMTKHQAASASHSGQCDHDVARLATVPAIKRQLWKLNPADVRAELREYSAWSVEELANHEQNLHRILWIAASNIVEGQS